MWRCHIHQYVEMSFFFFFSRMSPLNILSLVEFDIRKFVTTCSKWIYGFWWAGTVWADDNEIAWRKKVVPLTEVGSLILWRMNNISCEVLPFPALITAIDKPCTEALGAEFSFVWNRGSSNILVILSQYFFVAVQGFRTPLLYVVTDFIW